MTLDEEVSSAERVVQAGRDNAAQHLERVAAVMRLDPRTIDDYQKFLDATASAAGYTIQLCRRLVSACTESDGFPNEEATQTVQGLISGALESMKAMYLAMSVVGRLRPQARRQDSHVWLPRDESRATRRCSFCGTAYEEGKIVAGPSSNICEACTRLACGLLGITLQK